MMILTELGKIEIREGKDVEDKKFVRIVLHTNIGVKTTNNIKVFDMAE